MKTVLSNPGGQVGLSSNNGVAIGTGLNIYVVPTGFVAEVDSVTLDYTASATVGNRVLVVSVIDTGTVYWRGTSSASVAAAQIGGYDVSFGRTGTPSTTVRRALVAAANTNVQVRDNCPVRWLRAGAVIQVLDIAGIDVADTVTFRVTAREYIQ